MCIRYRLRMRRLLTMLVVGIWAMRYVCIYECFHVCVCVYIHVDVCAAIADHASDRDMDDEVCMHI
jgi:hypothetical protein